MLAAPPLLPAPLLAAAASSHVFCWQDGQHCSSAVGARSRFPSSWARVSLAAPAPCNPPPTSPGARGCACARVGGLDSLPLLLCGRTGSRLEKVVTLPQPGPVLLSVPAASWRLPPGLFDLGICCEAAAFRRKGEEAPIS